MNTDFSVIIPLYNKEREVEAAIRSVLNQTLPPHEIIIVDDGSTDGSAAVVEALIAEQAGTDAEIPPEPDVLSAATALSTNAHSAVAPAESGNTLCDCRTAPASRPASAYSASAPRTHAPRIRLVRQSNGGVCAARNRAVAESSGKYVAMLDADDRWQPGFLAEIAALIREFPDCGLYCTAFDIVSGGETHPAPTPDKRGIVGNFFRESAHRYIAIPSASVIPRRIFDAAGGFPAGMKLGEDQWMWFQIARRFPVCFSPERMALYSREASNRSASIYTPEKTVCSFEQLYDPAAPEEQNEFVARVALARALTVSARGGTADAARAARFFAYTKVYRRTLLKVRVLNALPAPWRPLLLYLYDHLAWRLAKKGL